MNNSILSTIGSGIYKTEVGKEKKEEKKKKGPEGTSNSDKVVPQIPMVLALAPHCLFLPRLHKTPHGDFSIHRAGTT